MAVNWYIHVYQFTAMEIPVAVEKKFLPLSSLWTYIRSSITCCIHNYLRIILSYILSHITSVMCKQVCALVQIGTGTNCSTWGHCISYKMKQMADKCHWERTNKICFIKNGHSDKRGKNFFPMATGIDWESSRKVWVWGNSKCLMWIDVIHTVLPCFVCWMS